MEGTYKEATKAELGSGLDRTCKVHTDAKGTHITWEDGAVTTFGDDAAVADFLKTNHFAEEKAAAADAPADE